MMHFLHHPPPSWPTNALNARANAYSTKGARGGGVVGSVALPPYVLSLGVSTVPGGILFHGYQLISQAYPPFDDEYDTPAPSYQSIDRIGTNALHNLLEKVRLRA